MTTITATGYRSEVESLADRLYYLLCDLLVREPAQEDFSALNPTAWESLGRMAQEHGLVPLVYRRLSQAGRPATTPVTHRRSSPISITQPAYASGWQ